MKALVVGTAACALDDVGYAFDLFLPDTIIAVNHIGIDFPSIEHWASCHIEHFPGWVEERRAAGLPVPTLWVDDFKPEISGYRRAPYWEGSSGQLGVSVAQVLSATHIVCAGIPLTDGPHYYPGRDFAESAQYRRAWMDNLPKIAANVRSMSGWTKDLLGRPTQEWLNGNLRPYPR